MNPPLIYNLFQRLVGPTDRWTDHAVRAKEMEFNWLYINPWHYPGFSGSLYAPKEFRRLNPLYLPAGVDPGSLEPLRDFLAAMRELGLPVMMDLVINHTSKDSPLVDEHPEWYVRDSRGDVVSPSVTDPDDPSKVTVWGDLAEIDNAGSPDRERLWAYWQDLVRDSLDLGFAGFRCDAAYMVPAELWRRLIDDARAIDPGVRFFAETLGAAADAVVALKEAGFDYFFNSSKWWNFREPWALEQHERFGRIAPSVSFPETHDTPRLAGETDGDDAVQRQRYAFAAAFSAGVMMPIGYEFGFRKQVDVVETMPSDWERKHLDLRPFVTRVNRLKLRHPLLHGEGALSAPVGLDPPVLVLERRPREGGAAGLIVVNQDTGGVRHVDLVESTADPSRLRLFRICRDDAPVEGETVPDSLSLARAEVVYLLPQ
ncbi:MAG: alpha-amylase family glycosyl hydrolase [Gemmatimonadota bacterium]